MERSGSDWKEKIRRSVRAVVVEEGRGGGF